MPYVAKHYTLQEAMHSVLYAPYLLKLQTYDISNYLYYLDKAVHLSEAVPSPVTVHTQPLDGPLGTLSSPVFCLCVT